MISFFRNLFSSRVGVILAIAFVGLVGLAFALSDVTSMGGFGGGGQAGSTIARVDGERVTDEAVSQRMERAVADARERQPGIDMAAFIAAGGLDEVVDQYLQEYAMIAFARDQGIAVSRRLVDGVIASLPVFQGLTGEFDEATFRQVLAQQQLSEAQVRDDISRQSFMQMLLGPAAAAAQVSERLARPYAGLLLEERSGQVALIPSRAMPTGNPPSAAELAAYYERNQRRYTLPERRAVRYAIFARDQINVPVPTEQQIRAYYQENSDEYGGSETRALRQVILPSEAEARRFYAEVQGGKDFQQAAAERGFNEPATIVGQPSRVEFAAQTSPEIAAAAFAAPEGGLAEPARSGLGWHVVRVAGISRRDARPLADVRPEIVQALSERNAEEAMAQFYLAIETALEEGASFEEVARARGLAIVTTPLVAPNGRAPGRRDFQPSPELPGILQTAFTMGEDEEPLVHAIEEGERYALVDVTEIEPSAPQQLAQIRETVTRDFVIDRASRRARAIAEGIRDNVNRGTPLAQAIAEAGVNLPAPQPASASRSAAFRPDSQAPDALKLMFRMAVDTAKLMRLPGNEGWYVVSLENIDSNADEVTPELVAGTRNEFAQVTAAEYAEQFSNAVMAGYEIERDEDALRALANRLSGVAQ